MTFVSDYPLIFFFKYDFSDATEAQTALWAVGVSLELILHWLSVSMAARGVSVSSFLYH